MTSGFVLKDGAVVAGDRCFPADVRVHGSQVQEIGSGLTVHRGQVEIDCSGCFIYPGLINAHDHLEFNLFPRLGEPPYANAYQWGKDLHRRYKAEIEKIQRIPLRYRLWWGAWKNLFSGVTRVVHHNPYYRHFLFAYPVDILKRYTFAHSLEFEPDLRAALSRRKPATPFLIHLAEGCDDESVREVSRLDDLGGIDERTVAVHAVNVRREDIDLLKRRRASIVWCPSSNSYLFGKTAPIDSLYKQVPVALGTDSSLTGSVSMFEELQTAQRMSSLSNNQLFRMVTTEARSMFNFPSDAGSIVDRGRADFFVVCSNDMDPYQRLISCDPGDIRFLMRKGRVVIRDRSMPGPVNGFANVPVVLNGHEKYVQGKALPTLLRRLKPYLSHYSYL